MRVAATWRRAMPFASTRNASPTERSGTCLAPSTYVPFSGDSRMRKLPVALLAASRSVIWSL